MDKLKEKLSKSDAGESSPTEVALLDLYMSVRPSTDRDELTVDDDLILLGTSSIQMGELGSKIRLRFGVGLPPTVMLAPPRSLRSSASNIDATLELAAAFAEWGESMSEEEVVQFVAVADTDQSGRITYAEFRRMACWRA